MSDILTTFEPTPINRRNMAKVLRKREWALREHYKTLSLVDELTGVENHRALTRFLNEDELRQSKRSGISYDRRSTGYLYPTHGLILYTDADGLTDANKIDHNMGDRLLKNLATSGKEIAQRPSDIIFRRGSEGADEFVIILPGETMDRAADLELRFRQALKGNSQERDITASLAIGSYGLGRTARQTVDKLDALISSEKAKRPVKGTHIETIYVKENV